MPLLASITTSWALVGPKFLVAALVTVGFAVAARWLRGVTTSGALAGAGICFVLYLSAGSRAFAALVTVFALTWITTRWGYQRKQKLGTAERRDGRKASQVLANLGVAALAATVHLLRPDAALLVAMAAALAEAAADTVSSEIGQAHSDRAWLVTTWKSVAPGTDGGITLMGTLAGVAAAAVVSGVCLVTGLISRQNFVLAGLAGIAGMLADSFLGASLERRGFLTNDAVNFLGTLTAALLAFLLA